MALAKAKPKTTARMPKGAKAKGMAAGARNVRPKKTARPKKTMSALRAPLAPARKPKNPRLRTTAGTPVRMRAPSLAKPFGIFGNPLTTALKTPDAAAKPKADALASMESMAKLKMGSPGGAPPKRTVAPGAGEPCCPRFNPARWNGREITFEDKLFLKDRVTSFMHMPLNFGAVAMKNYGKIKAAGAETKDGLMLVDENSSWGADVYFSISKNFAGADAVMLSGQFLTNVFEGEYSNMPRWMEEMAEFVKSRGKRKITHFLFYYPTCPKCSKIYGKNYTVIFAQVG